MTVFEVEESQGSSWLCSQEILYETNATRQVTVNHSYILQGFILVFFHHSVFFASMLPAQLKPVLKRYVASRQTNEPRHDKPNKMCAPSEDSDLPGHLPSLISLRCRHEESLGTELPTECTAKTLIRLGRCAG